MPSEAATGHFCFIGATGSGKTYCIRLLMQSVLYSKETKKISRALVYDAKRDMLPLLHGIVGPDDYENGTLHKVVTLNPMDSRSYAWDMSADITAPGHALEIASIFIPPEPNASQPFFGNAARHILQGVLTSFILSKKKWTLRDVLFAVRDSERISNILKREETAHVTAHIEKLYFSHPDTAKNIMSELGSKLGSLEIVAALWHKAEQAGRTISLDEWLTGDREYILVLGNDHTNRAAVDAINQVIFKRISELILDQPDDDIKTRRTWIILDEFVRAGKLNGVVELTTVGRSKGAAVVFGFQDINGARAVYGKEVAEEIIGQCSNVAALKLQSPDTAEWVSRFFGTYEEPEKKESTTESHGERSQHSRQEHTELVKRERLMPSELIYLPITGPQNGLHGFRYSPHIKGSMFKPIPPEKFRQLLWPKHDEQGFIPRDVEDQYLEEWKTKDYKRLGILQELPPPPRELFES